MNTHYLPCDPDGSITKRTLARAYAPNLTDHAALKRLSLWITANPSLFRALKKHGYFVTQKKFTKIQKRIIFRYLGAP